MAQNGVVTGSHAIHVPHDSALSVGSSKGEDTAKIRDLEDEVRVLAEKANAACKKLLGHVSRTPWSADCGLAQRFADYENEIRVLEAKLRQEQRKNSAPALVKVDSPDGAPVASTASQPAERPGISRFGSFIGSRAKPPTTQQNGTLQAASNREKELEEKFIKEQTTRIAAEKKIKEANAEIEDLTATLFQQANEMVATERKENAALREKLEVLEQENSVPKDSETLLKENEKLKVKIKNMEQRETDRKRRLERLEAASKRIERVRAMLQPP